MAFGPSRHRAWIVGQRALECSLGSRGGPFGGLLEAALKPLGGRIGASIGPLGGLLGALLGLSRGGRLEVSVRGPPLAPFQGPS